MGSTPPESPSRLGESLRSPSSQSAFIYPIKSAVSVKRATASTEKSTNRPNSRHGIDNNTVREAFAGKRITKDTFELQPPASSKLKVEENTLTELNDREGETDVVGHAEGESHASSSRHALGAIGVRRNSRTWSDSSGTNEDNATEAGDLMRNLRLGGIDSMKLSEPEPSLPAGSQVTRRPSMNRKRTNTEHSAKDSLELLTLPRFRHVETEHGHMVVTGREGAIARCEDEPIHIPGAVQSFGCMVVLREEGDGCLVVRQCSENTADIIGFTPQYLFSLDSFLDCLNEEQADVLWDNIEVLDESEKELTETGPHVFQLSGRGNVERESRSTSEWKCWCAAHNVIPKSKEQNDDVLTSKHLTVLEFELVRDEVNPIIHKPAPVFSDKSDAGDYQSSGGSSPPPNITTFDADGTAEVAPAVRAIQKVKGGLEGMPYIPTPEQLRESTEPASRPLKALQRSQRHLGNGRVRRDRPRRGRAPRQDDSAATGESLDVVGILSQVNEQLAAQSELQGFLKVVVSVVREMTNFSRVMVYQFDEEWNGQVVCELVDWNDTHDLYRGLHFPATDIPKQARDLYLINKVRLLYDRDQPSARMVCRARSDLETPIDMTHSFLRAMSPIHIKYLGNMGVRASMSISIVAFDQLWGLISLHTYGNYGRRVSFPMRQLCRLIGESVSRNIERLSYTRRLSARKLINTLPTDRNPSGYIISNAEDLLALFDADFGVIAVGNEAKVLGPLTASQEVLGVTEYLRIKKFQTVITSQDVARDFPDMMLPLGLEVIAGIMVIPLSSTGIDFITFMRKGQDRHVNWAGKPFKEGKEGSAVLEPRKSFKIWSEKVVGTCRAWKDEELETASVLCLVYGKFISVWRQREQAMQYNQLNKLLLSNATHEVRTPLNHIINYLEMALDSQLDSDTRENLSKSHTASKSLLFVINDLLDLTRHEEGNKLFLQEPFDLSKTVRESVEMHEHEAKRRRINFSLAVSPEQCFVVGDASRVRQVVVNTLSNSVKHTESGEIHVEMRQRTVEEVISELPDGTDMEIELSISDTGGGIAREKLESIFREFEQVESVIADPNAGNSEGKAAASLKGKESDSGIGLGLAIVARIVKNMGGQLRVDSTVGEGSRFTYYLPFKSSSATELAEHKRIGTKSQRSNSIESGGSGESSVNSEINSLVEAISAPHLDAPGESSHQRRSLDSAPGVVQRVQQGQRNFSAARVGPVQTSASDGSINVTGSAVPLRSVKVDPHELSTAQQWGDLSNRRASKDSATSKTPRPSVSQGMPDIQRTPSLHTRQDRLPMPGGLPAAAPEDLHAVRTENLSPTSMTPAQSSEGLSGPKGQSRRTSKSATVPANQSKAASVHCMRVLVVEDDQVNRMILKKRLGMDGHQVMLAVNGEDGVSQVEKYAHEIDVILMDLQMPICNGQDACRRIRALESKRREENQLNDRPAAHVLNGRIPIFAVSASLDQSMRQEMCDIGFDGWTLKPIDFSRLRTLMQAITDLDKRAQELWQPGHVWEKGGFLADPSQ